MAKKTTKSAKRTPAKKTKKAPATASSASSMRRSDTDATTAAKSRQKKAQTLEDLLESGLKDVYSAEQQLVEALPQLALAAHSAELAEAFEYHLQQTKKQAGRIEKIMNQLGIAYDETGKCEAMKGLIKEANGIITGFEEGPVRDAALIMAAQKVEHYEIAAYGSLRELTDVLGLHRESELLDRTLREEGDTDHHLSQLAMRINDYALETSQQNPQSPETRFS